MQYLCLIYDDEATSAEHGRGRAQRRLQRVHGVHESIKDSGNYVAGDALQPISTATTVRIRNGETLVTDGPFAETKEQLGGYYLVEAKDLDEAIDDRGADPAAALRSIEVRPVVVWERRERRPQSTRRSGRSTGARSRP